MSGRCDDELRGMMTVSSRVAMSIIDGEVGGLKGMILVSQWLEVWLDGSSRAFK